MSGIIPYQQRHNGTHRGRHLNLLKECRNNLKLFGEIPDRLAVLSFGCSSGEECADIVDVFPEAHVTGLEINPEVRTLAMRFEGPSIRILDSTEAHLASAAPYDIIFALNVLCLSPQTIGMDNIAKLYPFEQFDNAVSLLDRHLNLGGVLAAYNAQYFIEDTAAGGRYSPLPHPCWRGSGWIEKCAPNGDRVCRTIFEHDGIDYTWPEWDIFLRDNPNVNRRKHGRYRQEWISQSIPDRETATALWRKGGMRFQRGTVV